MDDERLLRTYTDVDDEWRRVDHLPTTGAVWVVARDGDAVRELAQAHRLSSQALRVLEEHPVAPSSDEESGRHLRGRVDRLTDGELVLSVSTVSYVEQTRDVRTGLLLCVLTDDLLITCERGEADVLTLAADRLCDGPLVPDSGVRQVLAAILLTLVNRASDVEADLGDAVADLEQLVVTPGSAVGADRPNGQGPLRAVYALKREIAEARRALGPMTSALPELEAQTRVQLAKDRGRSGHAATPEWMHHVRERADRVDSHLESHDALLDAMLSVYLSNVSVRQNEDMRKISAWAAMITVATLIAGIYGMNFRHMPELAWPYGYPFALVLMAGACLLLFRAFRRSGWL